MKKSVIFLIFIFSLKFEKNQKKDIQSYEPDFKVYQFQDFKNELSSKLKKITTSLGFKYQITTKEYTKQLSDKLEIPSSKFLRLYSFDKNFYRDFFFDDKESNEIIAEKLRWFLLKSTKLILKKINKENTDKDLLKYLQNLPYFYFYYGKSKSPCYYLFKTMTHVRYEGNFFNIMDSESMKKISKNVSSKGFYMLNNRTNKLYNLCDTDKDKKFFPLKKLVEMNRKLVKQEIEINDTLNKEIIKTENTYYFLINLTYLDNSSQYFKKKSRHLIQHMLQYLHRFQENYFSFKFKILKIDNQESFDLYQDLFGEESVNKFFAVIKNSKGKQQKYFLNHQRLLMSMRENFYIENYIIKLIQNRLIEIEVSQVLDKSNKESLNHRKLVEMKEKGKYIIYFYDNYDQEVNEHGRQMANSQGYPFFNFDMNKNFLPKQFLKKGKINGSKLLELQIEENGDDFELIEITP